jgi:outer membrane protein assembly factor BamE (lipoprotein component of BamABCDE complex)
MKNLFFSLLLLIFLAACASVGRKIDPAAAAQIERGKTTKAQVVQLLGSPDHVTTRASGDTIFIYQYARASAKPATFIPIFGPLVGGANVQHQMFMVSFGPDGIVRNYTSSYGATEANQNLTSGGKAEIPDVEQGKRPK